MPSKAVLAGLSVYFGQRACSPGSGNSLLFIEYFFQEFRSRFLQCGRYPQYPTRFRKAFGIRTSDFIVCLVAGLPGPGPFKVFLGTFEVRASMLALFIH
jgi:hypothetical protein